MRLLPHILVLSLLATVWAMPARAGTKSTLGVTHAPNSLISFDQIDHSSWNSLLHKYVDNDGFVNYAAWKNSPSDMAALEGYLNTLSRANPSASSSRESMIAFWCNAYNAVTVRGIFKEYPTTSIRNHTAKVFGYNIWHDLLLQVGLKTYSLNSIEHEILRKVGDSRVHFAIVCASIGCPRLLNEAYAGPQLAEQLTRNTRDFFSRSQNLQVQGSTIKVSSILKWFPEDFGATPEAGIKNLQAYLPANVQPLVASGQFSVGYLSYDWNLNDQARHRSAKR